MVLKPAEIRILEAHYKKTIQNLQRLQNNTPRAVVYFLAGALPFEGILHRKQLSLFNMICHLTSDPLNIHARYALEELPLTAHSWFFQVRDICYKYGLPSPIQMLNTPPPKLRFKSQVRLKVQEYWQGLLRAEVLSLSSLKYFKPHFYSLSKPHPVWRSAASNPFECSKSSVLALMMSGRYRTDYLCRHWSNNKQGYCLAPTC